MIERLGPYPDYVETGLPWLPRIPRTWRIARNGSLFSQRNQPGSAELPILEVSLRSGVRVRSFENGARKQVMSDLTKYKRAEVHDLAYNTMRLWQGAVGAVPTAGLVSPAYVVARPHPGVTTSFYSYLFRTDFYKHEIDAFSRGIVKDRNRLYWDQFKQMPSPVPPPEEQEAIVRFLDHTNCRIEGYIRAKRKLIALLDEQKQVIIHRAVTRGLAPRTKLKDSGVPYLEAIPEHWEVRRLRTLVRRIDQGVSPQASGFLAEGDSWGVLKSGCVNHGIFRETEHKQLPRSFAIDSAIAVNIGDVLISRACGSPKLVGSVARVTSLRYRLILSDKIFRPVFNAAIDEDFAVFAMNGRYYREQVEQSISGAEGLANNLPLSSLRDFVFAVPPLQEQREIATYLRRELGDLAVATERAERELGLLREYQVRLVVDVVTGRHDVRNAARSLPDDEPLLAGEDVASEDEDDAESEEIA